MGTRKTQVLNQINSLGGEKTNTILENVFEEKTNIMVMKKTVDTNAFRGSND